MDLWIRSQDKRMLTKVDYLYLEVNYGREILGGNHYMINQSLGIYESKERALEVLNEIQNILNPKYMIRMDGNLNNVEKFLNIDGAYIKSQDNADIKIINNSYVYEMPKE